MNDGNEMKITWKYFNKLVDQLYDKIQLKHHRKDFGGVYGIPRGGCTLAVVLSHKLEIPYVTKLHYGLQQAVAQEKKLLIVDDISDTGKTLNELIASDYPRIVISNNGLSPWVKINTLIATLHYHRQSIIEPNFWVEEKKDEWIVYPWEND